MILPCLSESPAGTVIDTASMRCDHKHVVLDCLYLLTPIKRSDFVDLDRSCEVLVTD